jgi:hypothetical protein
MESGKARFRVVITTGALAAAAEAVLEALPALAETAAHVAMTAVLVAACLAGFLVSFSVCFPVFSEMSKHVCFSDLSRCILRYILIDRLSRYIFENDDSAGSGYNSVNGLGKPSRQSLHSAPGPVRRQRCSGACCGSGRLETCTSHPTISYAVSNQMPRVQFMVAGPARLPVRS